MKKYIFLLLFLPLVVVGCKSNDPDENLNQPTDPSAFSVTGKIYISETTYEKSPAEDKYWVDVLYFFSSDSCIAYQTPNRDLTYHNDFLHLVAPCSYTLSYPDLTLLFTYGSAKEYRYLTFTDTTTIDAKVWDKTYHLTFK